MTDELKKTKFCFNCGNQLDVQAEICPKCGVRQPLLESAYGRNRIAAALLAIFLGSIGAHKFYLGKIGWGIVYLLFCWSFIPGIVGFVEGIIYLTMSDQAFWEKYLR